MADTMMTRSERENLARVVRATEEELQLIADADGNPAQ